MGVWDTTDYNQNGYMSVNEIRTAMGRDAWELWDILSVVERFWEYAESEEGLDYYRFEEFRRSFDEEKAEAAEWDDEGDWSDEDGEDWGGSGDGRLEIHMEEHPDGSNSMSIIMEGAAKELALTAGAVATMVLSAW